jgi:hypothetical protein
MFLSLKCMSIVLWKRCKNVTKESCYRALANLLPGAYASSDFVVVPNVRNSTQANRPPMLVQILSRNATQTSLSQHEQGILEIPLHTDLA